MRVLLALFLLFCALPAAAACVETSPPGPLSAGSYMCTTKGEAYAKAASMAIPSYYNNPPSCQATSDVEIVEADKKVIFHVRTSPGTCGYGSAQDFWLGHAMWEQGCPADKPWNETTKTCQADCATAADLPGMKSPDGSGLACQDGCEYITTYDAGPPMFIGMSPTGQQCTVGDDDGTKPPTPRDPNDPNDPNDPGEDDGDGDDDGEGEGDGDGNQAGGGETCAAPPTCTGDQIMCAQLRQTWLMRCKVGSTVTGDPSNCTATYQCTGDSIQCAQVAVMRKAACGIEGMKEGTGDQDAGQPNWTKGGMPGVDAGEETEISAVKSFGIALAPSILDRENIFGSGGCQQFSLTIMGKTATTADIPAWCALLAIMRGAVLLMAAFLSIQILAGRFG